MQPHRRLRKRFQAKALCLFGMLAIRAIPLAAQTHHFVYLSSVGQSGSAVSGFELDPIAGTLAAVPGSPFSESLGPGAMALSPDGKYLYVLNSPPNNSVSAFAVDPITGAVSELRASPFTIGVVSGFTPKLFLVEQSGHYLYLYALSTDDASGTNTSISYYPLDPTTGIVNPTPDDHFVLGAFAPVGFVSKPNDHFLYLVGTGSSSIISIVTFVLDPSTGTPSGPPIFSGQGNSALSVVADPQGQFLFVGRGQSSGSIDAYPISADGSLQSPPSSFPLGSQLLPYALAIDASGRFLYAAVANLGVVGFLVNSGTLAQLPGTPFVGPPISPSAIMAPDAAAEFLYYQQRAFAVSAAGALNELLPPSSPLPVMGVTGIAAASPLAPVTTLSSLSLQFSEQDVGSVSAARSVLLSNTGSAPLEISGISVMGTNAAEFVLSHNCPLTPGTLPPTASCTITVKFQPLSEGPAQAAVTIADNSSASLPHAVTLTGTGRTPVQPAPATTLAPLSLQFDAQNVGSTSASRAISLSNAGTASLAISGISLTGGNASEFGLSYDCAAVLAPGAACTIRITFQPLAPGPRQAALAIVDNSSASFPHSVALSGSGQVPFAIQLNNSSAAATIKAGGIAEYDLQLVPVAGFVGQVGLSCAGAPDQSTCDVISSVDLSGTAKTFSVMVSTKARSSLVPALYHPYFISLSNGFRAILILALALALALLFWGRRERLGRFRARTVVGSAAAALLLCFSLTLVSCAGSAGPGGSTSTTAAGTPAGPAPAGAGTPAGQYVLTLTATAGSASLNFPLNLAVQ